MNEALAKGVRTFLEQSGKDVQDVAAALGITRWSIYRRLQGRTPWTDGEIDRLAQFMGTTVPKMVTWIYKPQRP